MRLAMDKGQVSKKIHPLIGVSPYSRTAIFDYVDNNCGGEKMHVALIGSLIASSEGESLTLKSYELSRLWNALYIVPGRRRRRLCEILPIIEESSNILKIKKIGKKDFLLTPSKSFFKNLTGCQKEKKGLRYAEFDFSQVKFYLKHIVETLNRSRMPINGPVSNISMGVLLWFLGAKNPRKHVKSYITLGRIKQFVPNSVIAKERHYGQMLDVSSVCFEAAKKIGLISQFGHEKRGKFIINGRLSFEIPSKPHRAKTPFDSKKQFYGPLKNEKQEETRPVKFAKYLSHKQEIELEQRKLKNRPQGKKDLLPLNTILEEMKRDITGPSP